MLRSLIKCGFAKSGKCQRREVAVISGNFAVMCRYMFCVSLAMGRHRPKRHFAYSVLSANQTLYFFALISMTQSVPFSLRLLSALQSVSPILAASFTSVSSIGPC